MFIETVFENLFWYLGPMSRSNLPLLGIVILVIFLAVAEVGYRIGIRMNRRLQESARSSVGFAVGGMLALLGFLVGISLSMANSYYEMRRNTLLDEANAVGTAWLRAQTVGGAQGERIQELLRQYAPLRLEALRAGAQATESNAEQTTKLQNEMWVAASQVARSQPSPITALLLSSLNDVFDLAAANRRNFSAGIAPHILQLLFLASVLSVGAVGYHFGLSGKRQFPVAFLLLLLWSSAIVLIVDIAQPATGRVRVDDRPMLWTIQSFGSPPAQH